MAMRTAQELEDFEQELVDQYLLAAVGSGYSDSSIAGDRAVLFEFAECMRGRYRGALHYCDFRGPPQVSPAAGSG